MHPEVSLALNSRNNISPCSCSIAFGELHELFFHFFISLELFFCHVSLGVLTAAAAYQVILLTLFTCCFWTLACVLEESKRVFSYCYTSSKLHFSLPAVLTKTNPFIYIKIYIFLNELLKFGETKRKLVCCHHDPLSDLFHHKHNVYFL